MGYSEARRKFRTFFYIEVEIRRFIILQKLFIISPNNILTCNRLYLLKPLRLMELNCKKV